MQKIYAGIGSRNTPVEVLSFMHQLAYLLAKGGWVLRSGGVAGADRTFEAGSDWGKGNKEIFYKEHVGSDVMKYGEKYHPVWNRLTKPQRMLMARSTYQILGASLDSPVYMVVCWTKDGANGVEIKTSKHTGGTGQGIRIAADLGIPVFNLGNETDFLKLETFLKDKYKMGIKHADD